MAQNEKTEEMDEVTLVKKRLELLNLIFGDKNKNNPQEDDKDYPLMRFKTLFHEDFSKFVAEEDACSDDAQSYSELLEIEKQLIAFSASQELLKRQIIAVSGGFSSGKSSFINSLLNANVEIELPEGVQPTTAIPMYLLQTNDKQEIKGITEFGHSFEMGEDIFSCLKHDFLKGFDFSVSKYLPYIFIKTNLANKELKNICFIDTPGYNNSDGEIDLNVALDFIDKAQSMIWCIGIDAGTLPESDKKLLCDIQEKYPKLKIYFIITKAELKMPSIRTQVFENIKESLEDADIVYEGISVYSSKQKQEFMFDKICLNDFLKKSNIENHEYVKAIYTKINQIYQKYLIAQVTEREKAKQSIEVINKTTAVLFQSEEEINSLLQEKRLNSINNKNRINTFKLSDSDEINFEDECAIEGMDECQGVLQKIIVEKRREVEKYTRYEKQAKRIFDEMKKIILEICGYKDETALKTDIVYKNCLNCGAELKQNSKFCGKCGTPVKTK